MNESGHGLVERYLQEHPPRKGYVTRREVMACCAECLNLRGNGCRSGWDCLVPECVWYARMPWRGKPMPKRLQSADATAA